MFTDGLLNLRPGSFRIVMAAATWADLFVVLSLVTGTAALTLCVLTWNILRRSAVGRTVVVLTVVLGLFNLYHGLVLLVPGSILVTSVLKSITLTAVVLFIGMSIRIQYRVRRNGAQGDDR